MKTLYLIRHSKAEGQNPHGDRFRSLSPKGIERANVMVAMVEKLGMDADLFLTSPYLRARQTAELFAQKLSPKLVETDACLVPEGDFAAALESLQFWDAQGYPKIAVFTHNPFVSMWARWLLDANRGPSDSSLEFHTPTVMAIEFETRFDAGKGRFLWVRHPEEFEA